MTRRIAFLLALAISGAIAPTATALPSTDPKFRTAVKLPNNDTVVLGRDPFNPYAWYYIPPALRLATETTPGGPERPKFRWVEFTLAGKQHAVLQFAVKGDLDANSEKLCREAAVQWFERARQTDKTVVVPKPEQISLSPVGPIRSSALRSLVLRNNLIEVISESAGASAVVPVAAEPKEGEKKGAAAPVPVQTFGEAVTAGHLPGVTELTQETWVQYEISGPGVQVIRNLLTGNGQGGMILVYWGKYQAYAPELSVHVKMNVKAVSKFFRDYEAETSGWSFLGLIGDSETKVHDFIEKHDALKRNILVERIGGGTLKPEDWDKIEARLYSWVTNQVFDPKNGAVTAAMATTVKDPKTGELLNVGPIAAAVFGMPLLAGLDLRLGYGSSCSKLNVRAEGTYEENAEAVWKGFDVVETDLATYGAIGLQHYGQDEQAKLIGKPLQLKELPTLYVTFPVADDSLVSMYAGSTAAVDAPGDYKVNFDEKTRQWNPVANTLKNAASATNGVLLTFNLGTNLVGTKAAWSLPDPNAGKNAVLKGLPRYRVVIPEKNGVIAFGSDSFPFRPVSVTADPLLQFLAQTGPDGARGVVVRVSLGCELSADQKKTQDAVWGNPQVIGYGALPAGESRTAVRYVLGQVTGLTVQCDGEYRDAFLGNQSFASVPLDPRWVKAQLARLNERKFNGVVIEPAPTTGAVAVEPAALGLHRYGLSFNQVARNGAKSCEVRLTSETGKTVSYNVVFDNKGATDLTTNAPVPNGLIWLVTRERPKSVELETNTGKPVKSAVPEADVAAWADREGILLLK